MIHYKKNRWGFLILLFNLRGSVVPESLPLAILSALICFFLLFFDLLPKNPLTGASLLMLHPNPFAFFLQIAALTVAFHTNASYQRFWEARTHVQSMASYWADAASHLISFDELTLISKDKNGSNTAASFASAIADASYTFRAFVLHYFSLLHAVSIRYLLNDHTHAYKLEILGGLTNSELHKLTEASDHTFLVSHWINKIVARRHFIEDGLPVGGPVLSRTWQLMYLGMVCYNQACKIEDTPFPFPYMQLMYLLEVVIAIVTPVVIGIWVPYTSFAIAITFLVVVAFGSLFHAANLMDTPFGKRPNDLPLLELHNDFVDRLRILIDTGTAKTLASFACGNSTSTLFSKDRFTHWPSSSPATSGTRMAIEGLFSKDKTLMAKNIIEEPVASIEAKQEGLRHASTTSKQKDDTTGLELFTTVVAASPSSTSDASWFQTSPMKHPEQEMILGDTELKDEELFIDSANLSTLSNLPEPRRRRIVSSKEYPSHISNSSRRRTSKPDTQTNNNSNNNNVRRLMISSPSEELL